jgi:two-component system sensor histidine kinase KdpD
MKLRTPPPWHRVRYPLAAALCAATMLVALPLREDLDVANIDMLFLLTVFVIAAWLGRGPSLMAAFLGVALFDFFFVPPYMSFAVADAQYLVTFAVMLAIGLITSHLGAQLAERTAQAQAREEDTRTLYELASALGAALTIDQVAATVADFLGKRGLDAMLLVAEPGDGKPDLQNHGQRQLTALEQSFARSAFERNAVVEADTLAGTGIAIAFVPLAAPGHVRGVLAVGSATGHADVVREQRPLLEAAASLVAMILERLHYAESAQRSELLVSNERLRTSILASLSHDLRTPLTSLVGLADTLARQQPPLEAAAVETAAVIRDQAYSMHHMLTNLLEMARLQSGNVSLNREWQPFVDIVGSSTRLLGDLLASRKLVIDVPPDLPLISFDSVLMERVVCNLLENATKYSPEGARIEVAARPKGVMLEVRICNDGPGFPADRIEQVFDLFVRGEREPSVAGTGMGLAICKAIIAAHGGNIMAENHPGGACVRFTLPLGTPPGMADEVAA